MGQPLKVLVVDDSVIYRKVVCDALAMMGDVEVVGTAVNGKIALEKIPLLKPDILTLDLEMPELDGLGVLAQLRAQQSPVKAIMLSALTSTGAKSTLAALRLGAIDFVLKPSTGNAAENVRSLRDQLGSKLKAFAQTLDLQAEPKPQPAALDPFSGLSTIAGAGFAAPQDTAPKSGSELVNLAQRIEDMFNSNQKPQVICIGISTGGPEALGKMLPQLPGDLPVPIVLVQHMPPMFTKSLADDLNGRCALQITEALDGDPLEPGRVLIAPGGMQMRVERQAGGVVARVNHDPPENSCRPSVDYLFRSVANVYGGAAVGVIMTGMGDDGTLGCRLLKRRGATVVAQDKASCVVYGMPRVPVEEGIADFVVPLDKIAETLVARVGRGALACS